MDQYGNQQSQNNNSYSNLPSIAPQQLQQNASLPPHTLPPLSAQHAALSMHSLYGQGPLTAPHTPTTTTPNTPNSTSNGFQQQINNQPPSRAYQPQAPSYQQSMQSYSHPGMSQQTPNSMSHPKPIAPAPGPSQNHLVPLRPMNASAPMHAQHGMHPQQHMQQGMHSSYGPGLGDDVPTHVVGSQGRRGILPSAPGRPSVTATGPGSSKAALIPAKDADGKFPCPHCTKTYLHAKHLKRHLLRHTGDRPYMCVLCRDTFSRSDILKRHFQKCSIRRGNPTGASHLSHAQAHLKKSHPGPHKTTPPGTTDGDMLRGMNGGMNGDSNMAPFGVIVENKNPNMISNLAEEQSAQAQLSRSNSLNRMSAGDPHDRRNMSGPSSGRGSFDQPYNNNVPSTMSSGMPSQVASYGMNGHGAPNFGGNYDFAPQATNGALHGQGNDGMAGNGRGTLPMFGGAATNGDWSQMFQSGAQDAFMSNFNPNLGQSQMAIKAEPSLSHVHNGLMTAMYPIADNSLATNFPVWNSPVLHHDPLQQISTQLSRFCNTPGSSPNASGGDIQSVLSADSIKHLLDRYTNFQGHFPIIHMPTFQITEANSGLLLAMLCVGAVYSERLQPAQVRGLMEQIKVVIEGESSIYSRFKHTNPNNANEIIVGTKDDIEQIQALFLLQNLFIWHGTPVQREMARRNYPILVRICRAAKLAYPSTTPASFSVLHQSNVTVEHFNAASFEWSTWVEQEKRSRIYYTILLLDCAMTIYFNNPPSYDFSQVSLPLPADDAAWDARTAIHCAEALGLHGPIAARDCNREGSRRAKQPELNYALRGLTNDGSSLKSGTTNVFSKFILIHALFTQVWSLQYAHELEDHSPKTCSFPNTQAGMSLATINTALDKWKKVWDEDISTQYPANSTSYRRFGFCRDSIHFFYLAKYLIKNRLDRRLAPDQRFAQVMHHLKSVKAWVVSDSADRGEELGSVSDISKEYGATNLTLDMAQLFKALNQLVDSPVPGVRTSGGHDNMI